MARNSRKKLADEPAKEGETVQVSPVSTENAGATGGESTLASAVEESRARLSNEEPAPRKRGRPKGSTSKTPLEGEVVNEKAKIEIPSMVPQINMAVRSISNQIALRRDFPAYRLDETQAQPLAECIDKVLLRYMPSVSSEHPELMALIAVSVMTFGPIVMMDLEDKARRVREAMQEKQKQQDLNLEK